MDLRIAKDMMVADWQSSMVGMHVHLLVGPFEAVVGAESDGGVGDDAQDAGAQALQQRQEKLLSNSFSYHGRGHVKEQSLCQVC